MVCINGNTVERLSVVHHSLQTGGKTPDKMRQDVFPLIFYSFVPASDVPQLVMRQHSGPNFSTKAPISSVRVALIPLRTSET